MAENESQGISRRDLLKRGAALGGAVVWATPVVQTLGMGRAFATTSPVVISGCHNISNIGFLATCTGDNFFAKYQYDDLANVGAFEPDPGEACGGSVDTNTFKKDANGDGNGISVTIDPNDETCATVTLPSDFASDGFSGLSCTYEVRVFGGGTCNVFFLDPGTHRVCTKPC